MDALPPPSPSHLRHVHALFLRCEYRRCITACRQLIQSSRTDGPAKSLQHTFLQCHLALAHDELARAIHDCSRTKLPAIHQAELLYQDALRSFPTPAASMSIPTPQRDIDPFYESARHFTRNDHTNTHFTHHVSRLPPYKPAFPDSTHLRKDSVTASKTPTTAGPSPISPTASDIAEDYDDDDDFNDRDDDDDLESNASQDQIETPLGTIFLGPTKLPRDYSSISLLPLIRPQSQQHQQQQQPRTSQGLMRPIRTGEPPQQYYCPPRLPYSGHHQQLATSKLPRLDTKLASPTGRKQLLTASEQASPVDEYSPVSPMGSEDGVASNASGVSPIEPRTPIESASPGFFNPFSTQTAIKHQQPLRTHLEAMQTQLHRHLSLLEEAKQRAISTQATRTSSSTSSTLLPTNESASPLAQPHAFWPADTAKAVDKQTRILEGRQRGWKRKRFDAERYRRLAEGVLAEL